MKKINTALLVPSVIAVAVFLIATVLFFKPIFFDNKVLAQGDVMQWQGSAKELADYRSATGDEALWAPSTFSGMPAYLISVQWSTKAIGFIKRVLTLWMPSGANNIFLACVCYYMMLLAFRVRPYLAIVGALAFAFSSFMLIGLMAGHNARIGAMALIPLVMAGIHLSFSGKKILGFGLTATGIALQLRENHLQVTYYLLIIVAAYGLMQLIVHIREKNTAAYFKTIGLLIPAAILAAGTVIGQLWALSEYTRYSTRGKNELTQTAATPENTKSGLSKEYAFRYSNGILEPITALVPDFYGGSSFNYLVQNQKSETYQALVSSGNNELANQLAQYSSAYWGEQPISAPYYAGAIIIFLAVVGILFAERKYIGWLVPISIFAILLSWGSNFESFNYFLFDYLPGYNKFRSVTFGLIMMFFALPLLGMLGLEKFLEAGLSQQTRKKLWIAFGLTGGVCLLLVLFTGIFSFMREAESSLPNWFLSALRDDRKSLMRNDALRSFFFIAGVFLVLYFNLIKKIAPWIVYAFIGICVLIDLTVVDNRYSSEQLYKRKRESNFTVRPSEAEVLKDKSYYRVYSTDGDGRASYFFKSLTGYNGAPLRRYQDLLDSCISTDMRRLSADAQRQNFDFSKYGTLNMLNCKYIIFGAEQGQVIVNPAAAGPAWFVKDVVSVTSPAEEIAAVNTIDTRSTAVMDVTKFKAPAFQYDSAATLTVLEYKPNVIRYESDAQVAGLGVFSEIHYPAGWTATIDGKESPILRVNYALRALEIPAGRHAIEFTFAPKPYVIGNRITAACSWLMLLVLLGTLGWSVKEQLYAANRKSEV